MKRAHDIAWPIIGLGAVAASSWLLFKDLRGLSYASVKDAFAAISPGRWLMACASTAAAYAALAWYDRIALFHLGRKIRWPFVVLTSFVTYAIAHNIGASVLSGAVIRYRAYSTRGLTIGGGGALGRLLLFHLRAWRGEPRRPSLAVPAQPRRAIRRRPGLDRAGRRRGPFRRPVPLCARLAPAFGPVKAGGFALTYPRPPIAVRQLLAGPLELIGAAGIIFFALPAANPGFVVVLAVFLAAFCLALMSHDPGGLGVLEIAFLSGLPDAPQANVVAALLVFRLLYLILPFVFALAVVLLFERSRWRTFVSLGVKRAHAGNNLD